MRHPAHGKAAILFAAALAAVAWNVCEGQITKDRRGDGSAGSPVWTDIVADSIGQSGSDLTLEVQTAAEIPHRVADSCLFEFVLRPSSAPPPGMERQSLPSEQIIRFSLSHWDGSPWFSMNTASYYNGSTTPRDTSRVFDWKLTQNRLWVRFSLDGSPWSSVKWFARVFYGNKFVDTAPDTGFSVFEIRRDSLVGLSRARGKYSAFTFPSSFEPVLRDHCVPMVADESYRLERELTGIVPLCGDSADYVFNPFYGGAAIEGSPIYLGPGMWGKQPLWFVYFHELGHDFCNASSRFRQLYPLTVGLPPGPLPFNILFYEAWASLPAMFVYENFMSDTVSKQIPDTVVADLRQDWIKIRARFAEAWGHYKAKPELRAINPDIVDGLFLQFRDKYGWEFFKRFYALMRPQTQPLSVFDKGVPGDSSDLRIARATLTAAVFSVLAGEDLREDFRRWDFPIDGELFESAYQSLRHDFKTGEEPKAK